MFYLFNPFGEEILNGFLDNVERSWAKNQREIYLVYVEPLFADVIERRGGFRKVKETQGNVTQSYNIYRMGTAS